MRYIMTQIPTATLKRLPQYLEVLYQLRRAGLREASVNKISVFADTSPQLLRRDLSYTGFASIPKVGYKIKDLIQAIEVCLNWNAASDCILVGVGNLGSALLGYQEFAQKGLRIVAAFDKHPQIIGTKVHGIPVFQLCDLNGYVMKHHIGIGIITVPPDAAQATADLMVQGGIRAIWNFTPQKLQLPPKIIIEQMDMFASLAVLSRRLAEQHRAEND